MSRDRCFEHPVTVYYRYQTIGEFKRSRRLQGPFRVIVFCLFAILFPCLFLIAPLYIRYEVYKDVAYNLGESDLVTVDKPISTFWCSGHELWMNATFHAYLLNEQPKISEDLKQIEMKKHMQLADDALEYWGFFLLQGSKVTLSVCSRFDGARLMVVKGTKNLKHCALVDASRKKDQIDPWEEDVSAPHGEKIEVTFQHGEGPSPELSKRNNKSLTLRSNTKVAGLTTNLTTIVPNIGKLMPKSSAKSSSVTSNESTMDEDEMENFSKRTLNSKPGRHGRKPSIYAPALNKVNNITESFPEDIGNKSTEGKVESLHENMKVLKHKTRYQLQSRTTRTRRFILTDNYYDGENKDGNEEVQQNDDGLNKEEELMEAETPQDLPPNPVGNEPIEMKTENQAQNHEPETLGQDELIDEEDIRSSGSSFAKNLWSCYGGDTLFTQTFSPSPRCQSQDAMMKYVRMKMVHEVTSTGYYYYIFYSDNDIVSNDIFARFNIEKVEYNFPNYTNSCLNSTHCSLPLGFFSSEKVLLEVPLQDGVSDEDALAQMVLISTCRPRLGVYLIFPIAIIFFILCCAFM